MHVVEAAAALGLDAHQLCHGVGVNPADLGQRARWVELDEVAALLIRIHRATGDDGIGARIAEHTSLHGFLHYLSVVQPTVRCFFERLVAFQLLSFDRRILTAGMVDGAYHIALTAPSGPGVDLFAPYWLAAVCVALRHATSPQVSPQEVWTCGPSASAVDYGRAFGCRIRPHQKEHAVRFCAAALGQPLVSANGTVAERLEQAAALLLQAAAADAFEQRVRAAIRALQLADRPCEREAAAEALGISARTLQRRLEAEGASFRAVLDDVRRELAVAQIVDETVLISDIASRCGFSDEAAFNRAFHRWTGVAPRTYRRNPTRRS